MKKIRQFLTPGWVLTAIVAVAFSYVAFTVLAPWQLGKNTATQHRNEQIRHAFEVDPVDVGEVMGAGQSLHDGDEWRRVTARGEFIPGTEVLLRNRPVDGAPAIQVLAVFHDNSGENYVVNRGYVRPSGTAIPPVDPAPTGEVTISAYTRHNEPKPISAPVVDDHLQVYGIETHEISQLLPDSAPQLHHDWLQLDENSPGVIAAIPLPQLESGPYLSYGIQWIFFGIMAPAAVVWFVIAEVRERRRDREEQAAHEAELANSAAENASAVNQNAEDAELSRSLHSAGTALSSGADGAASASTAKGTASTRTDDASQVEHTEKLTAAEIRAQRLARRYGDSGHRFGGQRRDNRYDERF